MKLKSIVVGMKRSLRHSKYVISTPEVTLTARIGEGEDPNQVVEELKADLFYLLDELCEEEYKDHEERMLVRQSIRQNSRTQS